MVARNIIVVGNSPFHQGGAGPWAHYTLTNLLSAGFGVRAIFPVFPETAHWQAAFRKRYPAVQAAWYEMPTLGNPFSDVPVDELTHQRDGILAELATLLDERKADLIYVTKESSVWGVADHVRSWGIPCLATLHGNLLAMSRSDGGVNRWQDWIALYRKADLVTSCAGHMTASLQALGLDNLVTLKNGVDVERFRPRCRPTHLEDRFGIARNDIVMLHASNLHPIKQPLDMVHAFARAVRRDGRLRLIVVGDGDMRRVSEVAVSEHGIDQFVRFAGWVENDDMPDYYALADFTVLPSASEGLSMACLESMACGRFVVASAIPASSELIEDRVDGFLFSAGDVAALADAMVEAAEAARYGKLGAAARSRIERDFPLSHMRHRQLEIVRQLL